MSGEEPRDFGFLTEAVSKLFRFMKWLAPSLWLGLTPRSDLNCEEIKSPELTNRRASLVELYVLGCLAAELAIVILSCECKWSLTAKLIVELIVLLRVIEIVQVTVNVMLFDGLRGRKDDGVASLPRTLVLASINFIELTICFGVIYALNFEKLHGAGQPVIGFYFSIITQLTIGYGDVYPTGWLRIIAALQGLTGALFVILVFGRIVASLRPIQSNRDDDRQGRCPRDP